MKSKTKALQHLSKDKILKKIIKKVGPIRLKQDSDLYKALLSAIVSQQLSIKAANTIWKRFLLLFENKYPSPELVLNLSQEQLRSAGLSNQKAGYIKNIAAFALENTLHYSHLKKMSDQELINYLITIKGVGQWTVEMILMFHLKRPDVFPVNDLGIQNGIKHLYKLQGQKQHLKTEMIAVSEAWKPYRSMACMYIWRHKDALAPSKETKRKTA